jgi:hypothetical protein
MAESDSADPELREKFDHLLAGSKLLLEEEDTQECHIKLCANRLARLSDPAVRGVIVHEFAHVALALPTDPRERHDALMENRADALAGWWGFSEELQALSNETKPEPADETEA